MYDFQDQYADEGEEEGKIEVNLDDIPDDNQDFEEEKIELAKFMSKDWGLADLETGSEVYMSEMLGFEIEDAEEMEEQNEEDLLALGDPWSDINLKQHAIDCLKNHKKEYLKLLQTLPEKDKKIWNNFIV